MINIYRLLLKEPRKFILSQKNRYYSQFDKSKEPEVEVVLDIYCYIKNITLKHNGLK